MPSRSVDAIVLGAGMVGVSAALALQERGRKVVLVDRHGEAADETSFGNAGLIQSEAVIPYTFPSDPAEIATAALNRDPRAHVRYGSLPSSAQALWQYFQFSTSSRVAETAAAMKPLVFGAADEHRRLAHEAGASELLRQTLIHPVGRKRSAAPASRARRRCSSAAPNTSGFIAAAVSATRDEVENWKYCQSACALEGSDP